MRRVLAAATIPLLVGLPLFLSPSLTVSLLVIISGACLLIGVIRSSLPSAAAGATFALIALALALWDGPSPNVFVIVLFGLALLSTLELVQHGHCFAGAAVKRTAWHPYVRWWLARNAIAAAVALALSAFSSAPLLPTGPGHFIVGLVGVLIAFAAVTSVAWRRRVDRE